MFKRYLFLIMMLLLAACSPAELEPPAAQGTVIPVTRGTATPTPAPTVTSTPPASPSPTLVPTITRTPFDTSHLTLTPPGTTGPPPTRTPAAPLPRMFYRTGEGLWRTTIDGQADLLLEQPNAVVGPNGRQAIYTAEGDIWLVNLGSGQVTNLTADSGRVHCCLTWWPERPGTIVFGSWQPEDQGGPSNGHLSMMQVDGTDYTVLDEEYEANGFFAPGPDGQTIAYDRGGSAWLYHLERGAEPFNPADWAELPEVVRIASPAWSPNGQQLAWTVAVQNPDWRIAIAVFDLTSGEGWLLHPYENAGRGGWFPPPAWSPDGRWLAFLAETAELEERGIWVTAVDGSSEQFIAPGHSPVWDPDGNWLAFSRGQAEAEGVWLVQSGSWGQIKLDVPEEATIVKWLP